MAHFITTLADAVITFGDDADESNGVGPCSDADAITVYAPASYDAGATMRLQGSPDSIDTVPQTYKGRNLYQWNPNVTLLRTNVEENIRIGEIIAAAVNQATASVAVLLPMKGVSMLDSEGDRFWDPEADRACFDAIKSNLRPDIPVHEVDHNINDPEFADSAANTLLQMLRDDQR